MSPLFGGGRDKAPAKPEPGQTATAKAAEAGPDEWFLPEKSREYLRGLFKERLQEDVEAWVFTAGGEHDAYGEFSVHLVRDLARLSDKIKPRYFPGDSKEAQEHGVTLLPTILIHPSLYHIRFTGAPAGEEGRSLIESLLLASSRDSGLSQASRSALAELAEQRQVMVFVNPTCPYCPGQVINAFKAAMERPGLIRAECVESNEFPELANRFSVGSVPHTVINETFSTLGLEPEERLMAEIALLRSESPTIHAEPAGEVAVDVIIVGGGPAGLTAGIYAARSGLKAVVLEAKTVGGAVAVTPVVENYPGFASVPGIRLVEMITDQARRYVQVRENEPVREIKVGKRIEALTDRDYYVGRALILATGALWKKLGVPGEDRLYGHGVSHCAACDGYLYKNKRVVVVGGGNTALTNALYLKNLGAEVSIIHRRDTFRAQQYLQDSVAREGVEVIWNATVAAIEGEESVTGIRLKDLLTAEERLIPVDAVFLAIGERANTELAAMLGLNLDPDGNILVDKGQRTSIPRLYAAGDLTGGVRQIVTAIGQGAVAATSVFEDLSRQERSLTAEV